jgi:hypothetical protein
MQFGRINRAAVRADKIVGGLLTPNFDHLSNMDLLDGLATVALFKLTHYPSGGPYAIAPAKAWGSPR